jgi:hypothetical protein
MIIEHIDAACVAAFQVIYESPSQFSLEYSRLFGAPLLRDIKNLLQMSPAEETFEFEEAR